MAGPAPKTRNWSALENAHKPKGLHVIVSGLVEVSDANKSPVLKEGGVAIEQVLPLQLTIEACTDPAIKVKVWKSAFFHKEVIANQYEKVVVSWNGKPIAAFPVIDDTQHAAAMVKLSKTQNAAVKPARKAATKPAAKKAAPKKAAKPAAKKAAKKVAKKVTKKPKAVGGWAKGAKKGVKKSTKKVAKKKARKR